MSVLPAVLRPGSAAKSRRGERLIEFFLRAAAAIGVVTTVGIVTVLIAEASFFFLEVSPIDFFTGTRWSASILPYAFGVIPLITSTLMIAAIALVIAVPLGVLAAVWMSEFASQRVRAVVKPVLELLAGIPTIVYGFFALNLVGFHLALDAGLEMKQMAPVFFVWASVYNLFVVSVFWSFMTDTWNREQSGRLFGNVAAGGSHGGLAGPVLTTGIVERLGLSAVTLVSAAILSGPP
jgi:phosphate transport system permease protein